MGKKKIRWSRSEGPPPGPKGPQVYTLTANDRLQVVVLGSKLHGFNTHWISGRTQPCVEPRSNCRGCVCKCPRRWAGYLHVYNSARKNTIFLAITPEGKEQLFQGLDGLDLRGAHLVVTRERIDKRAPMIISVMGHSEPNVKLPPEIDPAPVLAKIWGIDEDGNSTEEEKSVN